MNHKIMASAVAVSCAATIFAGTVVVDSDGDALQRAVERIRAARKAGDTALWTVRVKGHNALRQG